MGGCLTQGDPQRTVTRVATDSRTLKPGDLFIALTGERFNGHEFARRAVDAGAVGAIVSRDVELPPPAAVVMVPDTLDALQKVAAWNRAALSIPVVAVTGSTGKTTTKDFIAAVLGRGRPVVATRGNHNNEIGVPLTLLEMDETTGAAVIEMGMRGPGEIDLLSQLAAPTAAVITNIGEAHVERLGTIENIARAKTEVLAHLPRSGFAFLHADSPFLRAAARRVQARVLYFGEDTGADYRLAEYRSVGGDCFFQACCRGTLFDFRLPACGRHNAVNALAAVGVGLELGMDVETVAEGLASARLSPMRQAVVRAGGLTIINDAYNANPASVKAALSMLREMAGNTGRVAVLGDMLELGSRSTVGHKDVGAACAEAGLHLLVTVGVLAREIARGAREAGMAGANIVSCAATEDAVAVLRERLAGRETVLVKGSRGMRMEEVAVGLETAGIGFRASVGDPLLSGKGGCRR